jgi:hypothetical protein
MENISNAVHEKGDGTKRPGPTKGEWQLLLATAVAFVLIVGGYIAFAFVFGHAWVETHKHMEDALRRSDRLEQDQREQ